MENISEYEIAQKRIKERGQKKRDLIVFGCIEMLLIILSLMFPRSAVCTLPFMVITALVMANKAVQYYYLSARYAPSQAQLDQELQWLFGENEFESAGTLEYAFAQSRIRKRQVQKWTFGLFHAFLFLPIVGYITLSAFRLQTNGHWLFLIPLFAFIYLSWGIRKNFPSQNRLAKIERKAGEELDRELQSMRPEKLKNEEKLKREPFYGVGDDGELVELNEYDEIEDDKPKNSRLSS